jgi:16S rRNA (uracil1498-N3)-methyltransferase
MSRLPRFFISPDQAVGRRITLTGEDVRHISMVLRMKAGDELLLCDGQGTEYRVKIAEAGRSELVTDIVDRSVRGTGRLLITLGQGLPKSDKMDWIAQKATELGVSSIVPLMTERTVVKVKDEQKRVARWRKICREAAMQSNRPDIPRIEALLSFEDFLRSLDPGPRTLLLFPWEEGTEPIRNILRRDPDVRKVVVLIGPEGGFSAGEAGLAAARGFHAVSLGPTILRTETAALAALAMIGYELL